MTDVTNAGQTHAHVEAGARSDIVPAEVIETFVGNVEPGDHVSLAVVLGSVAFCLVVIFATTAWWMLK